MAISVELDRRPGTQQGSIGWTGPRRRAWSAVQSFAHKMNGYRTNDAKIISVESCTSSPMRTSRDIESAAMDGERCAEAAIRMLK